MIPLLSNYQAIIEKADLCSVTLRRKHLWWPISMGGLGRRLVCSRWCCPGSVNSAQRPPGTGVLWTRTRFLLLLGPPPTLRCGSETSLLSGRWPWCFVWGFCFVFVKVKLRRVLTTNTFFKFYFLKAFHVTSVTPSAPWLSKENRHIWKAIKRWD